MDLSFVDVLCVQTSAQRSAGPRIVRNIVRFFSSLCRGRDDGHLHLDGVLCESPPAQLDRLHRLAVAKDLALKNRQVRHESARALQKNAHEPSEAADRGDFT